MYRLLRLALILFLLTSQFGFQSNQPASPPAWENKVDPWILDSAAQGQTEFLVLLKEQADLSAAKTLLTKLEKGTYVYNQLTKTAERTQAPILAFLKDQSLRSAGTVEYRPYWVANLIWVRGNEELVKALALRDDVNALIRQPACAPGRAGAACIAAGG